MNSNHWSRMIMFSWMDIYFVGKRDDEDENMFHFYNISSQSHKICNDIKYSTCKKINRKITNNKNFCGITMIEILPNRPYMNCSNCDNSFRKYSLNVWLNKNNSCPLCRCKWTDFKVYVNRD